MTTICRRDFLTACGVAAVSCAATAEGRQAAREEPLDFRLSLSQRSLRRAFETDRLEHLDFAETVKKEFDIEAVDYSSGFFKDHLKDEEYLSSMNRRAADQGVRQVLLMVDGEGMLAAADAEKRKATLDRHRRWIDAAAALGCRGVCVHAVGDGPAKEVTKRVVEALRRLTEHATENKINILVANEKSLATDPAWLLGVIKEVGSPRCGTFPLFDNGIGSERVKAAEKLMATAKGVCAAARDSNDGLAAMMKTVVDAGYRGYVSLEYRGEGEDEFAGVRAAKQLMDRVRKIEA